MNKKSAGAPVYKLKRPKPPRRPYDENRWRWLGAGFGLAFLVFLVLGLAWVVASGAGTSRWNLGLSPSPTPTQVVPTASEPASSPTPFPGTITGSIGYPSEVAPAQKICAVEVAPAAGSAKQYCIDHAASDEGTGSSLGYSLTVPAGTYYVYASLLAPQGGLTTSYKAYYNEYVVCQSIGNCAASLHNKNVPVAVTPAQTVSGINPTDWYALGLGQ